MKKLDKKIFGTLFFSIFGTVTGVGIVVPLLPVYAHSLGASGLYIGLIFGAFSISRTFLLPYFGRLSDKKGRKPIIVIGLFAYSLVSLLFILARNVEGLIAIRFVQGITSAMIMPATQAYVGEITPAGREGTTMGLFNLSMFCGLSIGPLLGGVIKDRFSLDTAFACMGFLALAGFFLSFFCLPPTQSEQVFRRIKQPAPWKRLLYDRNMIGLFVFRLAYAACIGVIWSFLPVLADAEFSLTSSSIGILVMLGVFFSGLLHVPGGFVADRVNRKMMVVIGGIIVSYAIFSFEWAVSFWDLVLANILFGIGGGIATPALMAMAVIKGNTTDAMGSVMGLMSMAHSMGMLAGALFAGLMMDIFHLRHAFPAGGVIMILGIGLFLICIHYKNGVPALADLRTAPLDIEV
ncbi:MAG: MFS transporter [Proteobacteria bacterium]|nr:MFS transporter [Pseudomonadota bacterium]